VSKPYQSGRRIAGLETEYGCLVAPWHDASSVIQTVRDWIFEENRFGLIDRHHRDWDEPPGNGGFLFNGGRVYLDMGHVEYCTAECATLADMLRLDRAGDRILVKAVDALGFAERVQFIRNNIDHHTGATFGCHENYSMARHAPLMERNILSLLSFLTLRTLFTGSGRVGNGPAFRERTRVPFQISQRADYIPNDFYEWVQHNRAIINTRDEPLADARKYRRLHLLHGDTHVLPSALFLKIGSTRLVLDLLEADDLPAVALINAAETLRAMSHQPHPPWRVELMDGKQADAVELLSEYRQRAFSRFSGRDDETDAVLALWERVENGLSKKLDDLIGLVDWVTKYHALELFRQSEGLEWTHPWLEAQDLEYHQVDPNRSLGLALANLDGPWGVEGADAAMLTPPSGTRAELRSRLMHQVVERDLDYHLDWDAVQQGATKVFRLSDPFQTKL